MAWLAFCLPVMVLAVGIAVLPVLVGSFKAHRIEHGHAARSMNAQATTVPRSLLLVICPVCSAQLSADTDERLVDQASRHAWRSHGFPSPTHILESATRT